MKHIYDIAHSRRHWLRTWTCHLHPCWFASVDRESRRWKRRWLSLKQDISSSIITWIVNTTFDTQCKKMTETSKFSNIKHSSPTTRLLFYIEKTRDSDDKSRSLFSLEQYEKNENFDNITECERTLGAAQLFGLCKINIFRICRICCAIHSFDSFDSDVLKFMAGKILFYIFLFFFFCCFYCFFLLLLPFLFSCSYSGDKKPFSWNMMKILNSAKWERESLPELRKTLKVYFSRFGLDFFF